jgi:hypothetical protein
MKVLAVHFLSAVTLFTSAAQAMLLLRRKRTKELRLYWMPSIT